MPPPQPPPPPCLHLSRRGAPLFVTPTCSVQLSMLADHFDMELAVAVCGSSSLLRYGVGGANGTAYLLYTGLHHSSSEMGRHCLRRLYEHPRAPTASFARGRRSASQRTAAQLPAWQFGPPGTMIRCPTRRVQVIIGPCRELPDPPPCGI